MGYGLQSNMWLGLVLLHERRDAIKDANFLSSQRVCGCNRTSEATREKIKGSSCNQTYGLFVLNEIRDAIGLVTCTYKPQWESSCNQTDMWSYSSNLTQSNIWTHWVSLTKDEMQSNSISPVRRTGELVTSTETHQRKTGCNCACDWNLYSSIRDWMQSDISVKFLSSTGDWMWSNIHGLSHLTVLNKTETGWMWLHMWICFPQQQSWSVQSKMWTVIQQEESWRDRTCEFAFLNNSLDHCNPRSWLTLLDGILDAIEHVTWTYTAQWEPGCNRMCELTSIQFNNESLDVLEYDWVYT